MQETSSIRKFKLLDGEIQWCLMWQSVMSNCLYTGIYDLTAIGARNSCTFSFWIFDLLGLPSLCLF